MDRVHENLDRAGGGPARARCATVCWGIASVLFQALMFPVLFAVILSGMFLYAARWLVYFGAALLAMVYALGSKQYIHYFPLAFLAPLFVGGLIDGIILLIAERSRQRRVSDAILVERS